ncbi:hypothetical protein C8Q75DRAFT_731677 [Abortiporus biennis]|nr:hypothetical protein C8Q75DRAFT_731677 [Abortiporus biennis]
MKKALMIIGNLGQRVAKDILKLNQENLSRYVDISRSSELASMEIIVGTVMMLVRILVIVEWNRSSTPIDDFFAQYFWFSFNPTRPVYEEFYRMCRESQWNKQEKLEIKARFKDVLVVQFNQFYGTDVSKLSSWQLLCRYIGLYPIPGNIDGCKALVQNTHVNIVDLVDAGRIYGEVTIFDTVEELREYSLKTGKIFPRENAKAGGVLRYLLRKIDVGPGMGSRGHSNI